jgi:hypothetical protein
LFTRQYNGQLADGPWQNHLCSAPLAVGILEKIRAGIGGAIDVAWLDAARSSRLSQHCGACCQQQKQEFQKTYFSPLSIENMLPRVQSRIAQVERSLHFKSMTAADG